MLKIKCSKFKTLLIVQIFIIMILLLGCFRKEELVYTNEGEGLKVQKWMRPYVAYVLPVMVGIIFVVGILSYL